MYCIADFPSTCIFPLGALRDVAGQDVPLGRPVRRQLRDGNVVSLPKTAAHRQRRAEGAVAVPGRGLLSRTEVHRQVSVILCKKGSNEWQMMMLYFGGILVVFCRCILPQPDVYQ